jgi:hypothetical protein
MRPVDKKNLEFIRWTMDNEGEVALKSWYDAQEPHVQKYILSLFELHIQEMRDLSSALSTDLSEAQSVLSQFMLVKT